MNIQCRFCGSEKYYLQIFIEGRRRRFPYMNQCHCVFCGRKLKNKEVDTPCGTNRQKKSWISCPDSMRQKEWPIGDKIVFAALLHWRL